MQCDLYQEWLTAKKKEDLKYYSDPEFREAYTSGEMLRKSNLMRTQSREEVTQVLNALSSEAASREIRVLSLGCGPGSDLLGIIWAIRDALDRSAGASIQSWSTGYRISLRCTGVDAFPWERQLFDSHFRRATSTVLRGSQCEFIEQAMEDFVHNSTVNLFDIISVSFVDAGSSLSLVGVKLPQMLSKSGQVFVMDNDIRSVQQLENFGFKRKFTGKQICLYTRGPGNFNFRYIPAADSAIKRFRTAERLLLEQQEWQHQPLLDKMRLQELQKRQLEKQKVQEKQRQNRLQGQQQHELLQQQQRQQRLQQEQRQQRLQQEQRQQRLQQEQRQQRLQEQQRQREQHRQLSHHIQVNARPREGHFGGQHVDVLTPDRRVDSVNISAKLNCCPCCTLL